MPLPGASSQFISCLWRYRNWEGGRDFFRCWSHARKSLWLSIFKSHLEIHFYYLLYKKIKKQKKNTLVSYMLTLPVDLTSLKFIETVSVFFFFSQLVTCETKPANQRLDREKARPNNLAIVFRIRARSQLAVWLLQKHTGPSHWYLFGSGLLHSSQQQELRKIWMGGKWSVNICIGNAAASLGLVNRCQSRHSLCRQVNWSSLYSVFNIF